MHLSSQLHRKLNYKVGVPGRLGVPISKITKAKNRGVGVAQVKW
jgi:hypothetical protein